MKIAFYAPMKAPDHPVPSGDRRMAQLLIQALEHAGHEVVLASRLRSYDGKGDAATQARIAADAAKEADALIADPHRAASPVADCHLWLTYHLYHKAPDHIGPVVSSALGIPYAVAEASFAPKQADGPWRAGHRATAVALAQASLVLHLNPMDRDCVAPLLPADAAMVNLPPFIDVAPCRKARANRDVFRNRLAARHRIDSKSIWIGAAAMMRPDAKQESYRILAEALAGLDLSKTSVLLAGDGEAKSDVRQYFNDLEHITFTDALSENEMPEFLSALDLYVWPGVNEAFGLALLQAQGCSVPALTGDRPGPRSMVVPGETAFLVPEGDVNAFRNELRDLLTDPERLTRAGHAAAAHVAAHHSIERAATTLEGALQRVVDRAVDRGMS